MVSLPTKQCNDIFSYLYRLYFRNRVETNFFYCIICNESLFHSPDEWGYISGATPTPAANRVMCWSRQNLFLPNFVRLDKNGGESTGFCRCLIYIFLNANWLILRLTWISCSFTFFFICYSQNILYKYKVKWGSPILIFLQISLCFHIESGTKSLWK